MDNTTPHNDSSPNRQITMSEVAAMTNYGLSAASNWRRRIKDFPAPTGTAPGGGDLFDRAEILSWLERTGRLASQAPDTPKRIAFGYLDRLRSRMQPETAIELGLALLALRKLVTDEPPAAWNADRTMVSSEDFASPAFITRVRNYVGQQRPGLDDALGVLTNASDTDRLAVAEALEHVDDAYIPDVFEALISQRSRLHAYRRSEFEFTSKLRSLISRLSNPRAGDTVLDPAAGTGGFLLDAARATNNRATLAGQEINQSAAAISILRMFVHGIDAQVFTGDTLTHDAFPDLRADLVICDPPYGLRWPEGTPPDARWRFGPPGGASADLGWVQHAIHHLKPNARALVVTPPGALFRTGKESRVRLELVRKGCVESIISLPSGTSDLTRIPLALWILRPPTDATHVLMINASTSPDADTTRSLDDNSIAAIADTIDAWRNDPDEFEDQPGFASVVRALDLLDGDTNLLPARWISIPERDVVDLERLKTELAEALDRIPASVALPDMHTRPVPDSDQWAISSLAEMGEVQILRSSRIRPEDYRDAGTRVISQRDLRSLHDTSEARYAEPADLVRPVITQPGDVILATIGDKPYAVVDAEGGSILGGNLQALRIASDHLDPVVIAALLSSPRTAAYSTGSALRHVKLKDIEVPRIPLAEAHAMRRAMEELDRVRQDALDAADHAQRLKDALVEGAMTGTIQFAPEGAPA